MAQITTVIPTFRRPKLLARAIRSVLYQDFRDFEIHVCDNASGDETAAVVRQIASRDPRVQYCCHPRNIGLIQNFAFGIGTVTSPFFNLLSDDDILLPGFFAAAIGDLKAFPSAMSFVGALAEVNHHGQVLRLPFESWRAGLLNPNEALGEMGKAGLPTWTSMVFRTELVSKIGNLDIGFGDTADIEFESRALTSYPAIINHAPSAVFFIHPLAASSNVRLDELAASFADIIAALRENSARRGWQSDSRGLSLRFREMILSKARAAACVGKTDEALAAAATLGKSFKAPQLEAVIRLMSSQSLGGMLARSAFRVTRAVLRAWRATTRPLKHRALNSLIAQSIQELQVEGCQ